MATEHIPSTGKHGETESERNLQELLDHILLLPFHAQQGILRTLAPRVIGKLSGEERDGFIRDLLFEVEKSDRGEPVYDYRPQDQSIQ